MWRTIFSQVLYQFIVLTVLLFAGPTMFGIKYNLINLPLKLDNGDPTVRMQHYTMLFHTFVLMNALNMINCRVIGGEVRELNVFRRLHHNWFFSIILLSILNFQMGIVSYPFLRGVFGCTPITLSMHITAFSCAVGSLLIGLLVKFTPYRWTEKLGNCMAPFEHRNFIIGKRIAEVMEDDPDKPSSSY